MNLDNRRAQLLDYLRANGKTSVNNLADTFETSGATIRSDLRSLEEEGLVIRRYGAAEACLPSGVSSEDRSMDEKQTVNLDRKCLIAKAASQLVNDGDSIILDCGSTTLQMVPHFERVMALTLMTNSIHIVNAVANLEAEHTVLMPGALIAASQLRSTEHWRSKRSSSSRSTSCLLVLTALISLRVPPLTTKRIRSVRRCARLQIRLLW